MYLTLVIVLIESQRSIMDACGISLLNTSGIAGPPASEARPATLGRPYFAIGSTRSITISALDSTPMKFN